MFTQHTDNSITFLRADTLAGVAHGFSTRLGGVSEGIFSSFNLGSNRGDEPERVRENYRRLCQLFGVGLADRTQQIQCMGGQKA